MQNVLAKLSLKEELIKYSHEILNGDIVACQKHKWACRRFLRDLEKEGTKKFPYIFDEDRAQRFFDWMELFKHRKGVLAGQRIKPHIIQKFNFGNIYGWVHQKTELRRFKKGYWQVGRKNAKSQSLGTVASYESSAFGEPSAEVYCAATKKDQAKLVWEETEGMLMGNPDLRDKFRVAYGTIKHIKSGSIIKPLSKEDRKTGDGTNPSAFIVDEYHAHDTSEMYDIGDSGMGARSQPLMMIITTAGFNLHHPCYRVEYKYVSQILDPDSPIENDEYFVMINELDKDDDIKDESLWPKANPIICSYDVGMSYLRSQLKIALDVPEKMRNFLTKNMNLWVDAKQNGYMNLSKWTECGKSEMPDLKGKECFVGVDLSKKIDLTSIAFEFPLEDGFYAIKHHSFMPEDSYFERRNTDNVPYDLWVEQGFITLTPGAVVDYSYIEAYIERMERENGWIIKEVPYDPYNATQFSHQMEAKGYLMVEIRQGVKTLGEPTKNFRECVYQKKIIHDNDPVLTWAIGNAVTKEDAQGNIMLDKAKSTERIDPIAAGINAHVRAMLNESTDLSSHFLNNWSL